MEKNPPVNATSVEVETPYVWAVNGNAKESFPLNVVQSDVERQPA